jgi:nucleotide-binding universal stress UspA family protein
LRSIIQPSQQPDPIEKCGVQIMFEKILVAISFATAKPNDDAESSHVIFDRALMLAKANSSALMLMHVLTIVDRYYYPGSPYHRFTDSTLSSYSKQLKKREQAGIEKRRFLVWKANAAGVLTEFTQNIGDPGKSICEVAESWNANLIIIGRGSLNGLSELLLDSTNNYIIYHTPCDVLTIQDPALVSQPIETKNIAIQI